MFDFAPDRTGPPPLGIRRSFSRADTITRILCDRDTAATPVLYFSGHGFFQPEGESSLPWLALPPSDLAQLKIEVAQPGASTTSAYIEAEMLVRLPPSGGLFLPKIDVARLANVYYLTACNDASTSGAPGSSAENLHPSLSLCLRALYERQSVLTGEQATALKRQLQTLLEDEEELQSANISVSILSLHRLIDFLSEHQTSALPSLSITQAGYFAASWSPRKRAKLTVVFRPEGVADWITTDLNATPPVHQKDTLANRLGEFAAWTNA
jgi:hypothetical protein